jgi:hypothetical protein
MTGDEQDQESVRSREGSPAFAGFPDVEVDSEDSYSEDSEGSGNGCTEDEMFRQMSPSAGRRSRSVPRRASPLPLPDNAGTLGELKNLGSGQMFLGWN